MVINPIVGGLYTHYNGFLLKVGWPSPIEGVWRIHHLYLHKSLCEKVFEATDCEGWGWGMGCWGGSWILQMYVMFRIFWCLDNIDRHILKMYIYIHIHIYNINVDIDYRYVRWVSIAFSFVVGCYGHGYPGYPWPLEQREEISNYQVSLSFLGDEFFRQSWIRGVRLDVPRHGKSRIISPKRTVGIYGLPSLKLTACP